MQTPLKDTYVIKIYDADYHIIEEYIYRNLQDAVNHMEAFETARHIHPTHHIELIY